MRTGTVRAVEVENAAFEFGGDIGTRVVPRVDLLVEASRNHLVEVARTLGPEPAERYRFLVQNLGEHFSDLAAGERATSAEEFVGEDSEGEDIRS